MHSSLSRLLRCAALAISAAGSLLAQLEIHGMDELARLAEHTRVVLRGKVPKTGEDLWHMMAAHLRLGAPQAAKALLTAHTGSQQPEFLLAAFATMRRTTGEELLPAVRLRALEQELNQAEQEPFPSYRDAALQIHGRYCLAQLDDESRRGLHERHATTRLLALESETWQPGRGHYRPMPCRGKLLVPAAADASLLAPLSFGMLLGSGNRYTRHLRSTLIAARSNSKLRWQSQQSAPLTAALRLTAATQIADAQNMADAFATVVNLRANDPGTAARNLNAALLAVTGVRLAAGGGLNTRWLRIKPWLPDGVAAVSFRGILAMGHQFAMSLRRRQTNATLRVTIKLPADEARPLPLVVGNRWQQFVTEVRGGQPFECALPRARQSTPQPLPANSKANDDALHRFGFRCRRRLVCW